MSQTPSVVEKISSWLREVKAGEALSEPGGYQGATTHPSKSIDDNLQETTTGSRASENSADTKETVPLSIEKTPEATPGSGPNQDTGQINIGPQQSATGEAPAVEDDFKGKKEDPGTSHPAKADDGEKYASLSLEALEQELTKQSNALLAAIVSEPAAAAAPATSPATKTAGEVTNPATAAAISEQEKAAAAGYATAAALGANGLAALDPSLREGIVDYTASIIKTACEDADRLIAYLHARRDALQKQADDDEDDDDDAGGEEGGKKPKSDSEGSGESHESGPPAGGGGGGAPSGPPAAVPGVDAGLMAAMSGGGAPASPAAPGPGDGSVGGPPGGAPPMGGDPLMGGGAPPMGGAPGGAPGGGADPALVQELLSAMNEMGITVEDLMAAQQAEGPKLAHVVATYRRSGQYKFEATKNAAQRAQRDQMRNYLRELCPNK